MSVISLLLPTRFRHDLLIRTLDSVVATTCKASRVELIGHANDDDPRSREILNKYANLVLVTDMVGYGRLPEIINAMAERASGDWLFPFADDVECMTQWWDDIIREHDCAAPALLIPKSNQTRDLWFPIVSRAAYNAMGMLTASQFHDVWLRDVFAAASCPFYYIAAEFWNGAVCQQGLRLVDMERYQESVVSAAARLGRWRAKEGR